MGRWVRAAAIGVGSVAVMLAVGLVVLQLGVGPYPWPRRWFADGFFVMPLLAALVVAAATEDVGSERAGAWLAEREITDSPEARRYVRRWVMLTRTCRALGFFSVSLVGTVAVWSVNSSGLAADSAVRERLLDIVQGSGWAAGVVGYAVGALVAEAVRPRLEPAGARTADLRPRVPAAYMQPMARWGPRALATVGLGVAALSWISGHDIDLGPSSAQVAMTSAGVLGATEAVRWAIVRHRQRANDPESLALDDAARATTIHAISGSAIAIIGQPLGGHLEALSRDLTGPLQWAAMAGSWIWVVTLGVWLGYGVGLAWVVRRAPHATNRPVRPSA